VVIITRPETTAQIVRDCREAGVRRACMRWILELTGRLEAKND